jgi:glucokinase
VAVGNDVKAAALAEARWGGLAGARCGIFLNLGTGLAASVVLDGRLLEGAHGAAGEIGYQLRDRRDIPAAGAVAPTTPVRAPLEEFVSGRALAERGSRLLGRRVSTAQVFEAADLKPELGRLVDEAVDTLAVHTANLATALDPDRIVVGGGLLRVGHRILPRLEEVLNSAVPFPPGLRRAHFAYDAPLHGAAVLALDATRDVAARAPSGRTGFTGPARR